LEGGRGHTVEVKRFKDGISLPARFQAGNASKVLTLPALLALLALLAIAMFEIIVTQHFKASHAIRALSGELEPSHAHDWQAEAVVVGRELDASGCVVDFALIQRHLRSITSTWDGKNLNELGMFLDIPPSTEYLAKCLFDQLQSILAEEGVTLKKITVWETENCGAAFLGL